MSTMQRHFVFIGLVLGVAAGAARAELVTNGGFESGQFFPWLAPGPIFPPQPNPQLFQIGGDGGHTGDHYASLSSTTFQYINQFLPTVAGIDYELSFWIRRPSNFSAPLRVRWEGQVVFNQFIVLPDSTNWFEFTVPLHSNITGSLLEFGQNDFPLQFHIDDISVVQVPTPGAAALIGVAGLAALARRRRG